MQTYFHIVTLLKRQWADTTDTKAGLTHSTSQVFFSRISKYDLKIISSFIELNSSLKTFHIFVGIGTGTEHIVRWEMKEYKWRSRY